MVKRKRRKGFTGHLINNIIIEDWDNDRGGCQHIVHYILKTEEKTFEESLNSIRNQFANLPNQQTIVCNNKTPRNCLLWMLLVLVQFLFPLWTIVKSIETITLYKSNIDFIAWSGDWRFNGREKNKISWFVLGY
jgi:hypothetical protein